MQKYLFEYFKNDQDWHKKDSMVIVSGQMMQVFKADKPLGSMW